MTKKEMDKSWEQAMYFINLILDEIKNNGYESKGMYAPPPEGTSPRMRSLEASVNYWMKKAHGNPNPTQLWDGELL